MSYQPGTPNLSNLPDVSITTPVNGQTLTYNSSIGKWESQTPAAAAVEGSFSTWTLLKRSDAPPSSGSGSGVILLGVKSDETKATILDTQAANPNLEAWDLSLNTFSVLPDTSYSLASTAKVAFRRSAMGRYVVSPSDATGQDVHIFKDAALQQTLSLTDLGGGLGDASIDEVSISGDGKYVFVTFSDNLGADAHWVLLKGA